MNQTTTIVSVAILAIALSGHYLSQKLLLAKGWKSENPSPIIKRLMINGVALIVIAIVSLSSATYPYGLFGIMLFIESAVCFAFARKLSKK